MPYHCITTEITNKSVKVALIAASHAVTPLMDDARAAKNIIGYLPSTTCIRNKNFF
ncbi:MAG: hypothetical protein ACLTS6_01630 [Anaerobutyricum sp.]